MPLPFFKLAMISPDRQLVFRRTVTFHLVLIAGLALLLHMAPRVPLANLSHLLLIAAIVEGAVLIGWRLAQLPKSQALEFLLVSPLQPRRLFLSEALAGLGRLALVILSGVPLLMLLVLTGKLDAVDVPMLTLMPFLWGGISGLGLTAWAYERRDVRRWGERVMLVLILVYLIVGVLAAERLSQWLTALPWRFGEFVYRFVFVCSQYNPFGFLEYWLSPTRNGPTALQRALIVATATAGLLALLTWRAACRLKEHFHDRHYRPLTSDRRDEVSRIGERPLAWWAVRRVMEYSGRMNIWLAGGFGFVYAAYLVAGDAWPPWMGTMVFQVFERMGGVPMLSTSLVVMSAVPAAFQYGLWDPSAQDRSRRLELLLMTELDGTDYWGAALRAAWRRGRGYFLVAGLLWTALALAGRAAPLQILLAAAAGLGLWMFYFAMGFRAFSRGMHANGLGTLLTVGLPILAAVMIVLKVPFLPTLLPPGAVYAALRQDPSVIWWSGPIGMAAATLRLARISRRDCVNDLRKWLDQNHGAKVG